MKIHQRLIKQLRGYSDLLDYFQIPPAPTPATRDEEDEDQNRGEELYYPSSVANIQDFDEYSLTSFASTTSSSLVELSQPQQAQPTADDDDNDDDDAIPKAKNAYNNNPNTASNPVPIALVNIRQKLEEA